MRVSEGVSRPITRTRERGSFCQPLRIEERGFPPQTIAASTILTGETVNNISHYDTIRLVFSA